MTMCTLSAPCSLRGYRYRLLQLAWLCGSGDGPFMLIKHCMSDRDVCVSIEIVPVRLNLSQSK